MDFFIKIGCCGYWRWKYSSRRSPIFVNLCKSVTLIHRRDTLRAEQILQERIFKQPNISVEWNYTVTEILGNDRWC